MASDERRYELTHKQLGFPTEPGTYPLPRGFVGSIVLTDEIVNAWSAKGFTGRLVIEERGTSWRDAEYVVVGLP